VAGQPVTTDGGTVFIGGNAAALGPDVAVEVEGIVTASGVILADSVAFETPSQARLEGPVTATDSDAGTLTAAGVTVRTDSKTLFRDASDARMRPFGPDDIATSDRVEVAGTESGSELLARSVTRVDAVTENVVVLRALAREPGQDSFVLLGVTVVTDAATVFEDNDEAIDAAAFYAAADGSTVEVEGMLNGVIIDAERVSILID
jgi:hypothetical protein